MDREYYESIFSTVANHILNPDGMTEDYKHYYQGLNKGCIVADDDSGEVLDFVKKSLQYDKLKAAGKIEEITIDDSWSHALRKKEQMSGREAWNELVASAYKANLGLLVITIKNIEIFKHCWKLKQLAKQEADLEAWPPESRKDITPVDREFIKKNIPERFSFDGNVLLVIDGIGWTRVCEYAKKHNNGEFDAMMQFYRRVRIED